MMKNKPLTKYQMLEFKSTNDRFLPTGVYPNRRLRRLYKQNTFNNNSKDTPGRKWITAFRRFLTSIGKRIFK
jgi:hypothetical protein